MKSYYAFLIGLFALTGCEKTNECEALEKMLTDNQKLLSRAQSKAAVHDRIAVSAAKTEKDVGTFLDGLGLNWAESKLNKTLDSRMSKYPGTRVIRKTRSKVESSAQNLLLKAKTFWSIEYTETDIGKGVSRAYAFAGDKPLFMMEHLAFDPKTGAWLLELGRAVIDEVPNKANPVPLDALGDPSTVASDFGFCGAGGTRTKLKELQEEYESLRKKAEAITVLLPQQATWKGLKRRGEILHTAEIETRRIIHRIFKAIADLKFKFRGVAFEEPFEMVEIKGGEKQAKRLIRHMGVRAAKSQIMKSEKGRIRVLVPHQVIESLKNKKAVAPRSRHPHPEKK